MLMKRISNKAFDNEKRASLRQTVRNIQPTAWVYEEGDPFKQTEGVIFTMPDGELVCVPHYGNRFAYDHAYYMVNPNPAITAPVEAGAVRSVTTAQIAGSKGDRLDEGSRKWLRDCANAKPTPITGAGPEPQ